MPELRVTMDFACCFCSLSVGVTVQCAGSKVALQGRTVAAVNVPCPNCGSVNQLCFEPNGTVRAVSPVQVPREVPEPSVN
jgi:phage FluMu protein Com